MQTLHIRSLAAFALATSFFPLRVKAEEPLANTPLPKNELAPENAVNRLNLFYSRLQSFADNNKDKPPILLVVIPTSEKGNPILPVKLLARIEMNGQVSKEGKGGKSYNLYYPITTSLERTIYEGKPPIEKTKTPPASTSIASLPGALCVIPVYKNISNNNDSKTIEYIPCQDDLGMFQLAFDLKGNRGNYSGEKDNPEPNRKYFQNLGQAASNLYCLPEEIPEQKGPQTLSIANLLTPVIKAMIKDYTETRFPSAK